MTPRRRPPTWAVAAVASVALHLGLVALVWRPVRAGPRGGGAASSSAPRGSVVRVQVQLRPPVPEKVQAPVPVPEVKAVASLAREAIPLDAGVGGAPSASSGAPEAGAGAGVGERGASSAGGAGNGGGDIPLEVTNHGFDYSTPPSEAEISPQLLAVVHAHFARAAAECYPPAARRFNQSAEVTVSLCVGPEGVPDEVEVSQADASPMFLDAVRNCVIPQATPLPLAAIDFCFRVPVRFGAPP